MIELRVTEVDELIRRRGLLLPEARNDEMAIRKALHRDLDLTLTR